MANNYRKNGATRKNRKNRKNTRKNMDGGKRKRAHTRRSHRKGGRKSH